MWPQDIKFTFSDYKYLLRRLSFKEYNSFYRETRLLPESTTSLYKQTYISYIDFEVKNKDLLNLINILESQIVLIPYQLILI